MYKSCTQTGGYDVSNIEYDASLESDIMCEPHHLYLTRKVVFFKEKTMEAH